MKMAQARNSNTAQSESAKTQADYEKTVGFTAMRYLLAYLIIKLHEALASPFSCVFESDPCDFYGNAKT